MSTTLKLPQLNVCTFAGRLVAEPREIPVKNGDPGAAMTIAINRKSSGGQSFATFVPAIVWGDSAKAALAHLHKGSAVLVSGSLSQSKGTKKELQVSISALQFLDSAPKEEGGASAISSEEAPAA